MVIILLLYKKNDSKSICINYDYDKNDEGEYKQNEKIKIEREFVGRFVTDEECQQMMKNRKSDISVLLEEVNKEYGHLKELNK